MDQLGFQEVCRGCGFVLTKYQPVASRREPVYNIVVPLGIATSPKVMQTIRLLFHAGVSSRKYGTVWPHAEWSANQVRDPAHYKNTVIGIELAMCGQGKETL